MTDHGIAGEAYDLVHGERAKSYGHPRHDFKIIAKIWSGLLQDLLKPGEELDEYRVAVLMSGLKLARLVKSPDHHDSRVDTIGYMLTMERLDEPTEEELLRIDAAAVLDDDLDDEEITDNTGDALRLLDVQPLPDNLGDDGPRAYVFAYVDDETLVSGNYKEKTVWAESYRVACAVMKKWESEQNFTPLHEQTKREMGKLLAQDGDELLRDDDYDDVEEDEQFKVPVDGELADVVSGRKSAGEIEWQEGDRLETLGGSVAKTFWVYGESTDKWFNQNVLDACLRGIPAIISFRDLRSNYSPLRVTSGTCEGLLILKDGVGYAP